MLEFSKQCYNILQSQAYSPDVRLCVYRYVCVRNYVRCTCVWYHSVKNSTFISSLSITSPYVSEKNPCPRPTLHWIKLLNHNMWYAVTRTIWWCVLSFWCFQKPSYFRKINIFDTIYMICRVRYEHKLNIFFILCSLFDVFISHTYVRLKVFRLDNLKMIQIFGCAIFAY